jgi:NAD+ kinase
VGRFHEGSTRMTNISRLRPGQPAPPGLHVVIAGPGGSSDVEREAGRLRDDLARAGHSVSLRLTARNDWGVGPFHAAGAATDLAVVLGGDGTILRTAKWLGYEQAPVLGFNLGTLGFLADFSIAEAAAALADINAGEFRLVEHLMFETEIIRDGVVIHRELGLNETSILAGPPFSIIEICLFVDGDIATTYRCDGLIVSTPVGSTAYNLSAGGPIVRKDLEAFVFTPLSPHTLTNRTVVDSAVRTYELLVPRPNEGSACVVDGRVVTGLAPFDRVRVRRAEPRFALVETRHHGYYRTLRDKLHWGGGIHGVGGRARHDERSAGGGP